VDVFLFIALPGCGHYRDYNHHAIAFEHPREDNLRR
jgi:hypothetical protein